MLLGKNGEKLYDPRFCFSDVQLGTKIKLTVLVDDGKNPPYKARLAYVVSPEFGVTVYGTVCSRLLHDLMATDFMPPEPCKCQSREWLEAHSDDIQEYWRTTDGRVYAKDHTNLCPNKPKNRSKNG